MTYRPQIRERSLLYVIRSSSKHREKGRGKGKPNETAHRVEVSAAALFCLGAERSP
jgi:hypothetical protein